ncbi:recombinase family protein [Burkholderia ambifaria]|uniref:recombinase family protein n=1 Tax=Burkholderia ambifaria TaxID=152480 RepID=UPI001E4C75D3|nr:recombinase family protein [Burkholderia ambifaria]UEP23088.1 recombinase family protein [Burkholderia ambifaria]
MKLGSINRLDGEYMIIGYARVSTEEQHLDLQYSALEAYKCDLIFSDQGISGAKFDRPGLDAAIEAATPGGTLVVWRLDRLGRSLSHLIGLVTMFNAREVQLVSLTESLDTRSPTGRFTFHMIAALAEFERSLISERTRAGMASARSRGSRIGRPRTLDAQQCARLLELLKTHTKAEVAAMLNIDRRTMQRYLAEYRSLSEPAGADGGGGNGGDIEIPG